MSGTTRSAHHGVPVSSPPVFSRQVVVVWLTWHGNSHAPFPVASAAWKARYWQSLTGRYSDILFNPPTDGNLSTLSLDAMVARGRRLVVYAADHAALTATLRPNETFAFDAATFTATARSGNVRRARRTMAVNGSGQESLGRTVRCWRAYRAACKAEDKLCFVGVSFGPPKEQPSLATVQALPRWASRLGSLVAPSLRGPTAREVCAESYAISGMQTCPPTLIHAATVANYQAQWLLVQPLLSSLFGGPLEAGYPNAIYANALDLDPSTGGIVIEYASDSGDPKVRAAGEKASGRAGPSNAGPGSRVLRLAECPPPRPAADVPLRDGVDSVVPAVGLRGDGGARRLRAPPRTTPSSPRRGPRLLA